MRPGDGAAEAGGDGPRRRLHRALAVVVAAGILAVTLLPAPPPGPEAGGVRPDGGSLLCVVCGSFGTADLFLNAAFFLPLGVLVHLSVGGSRGPALALLAGLALSVAVEAGQLLVPGRYSALGDLLANGAGAGLGGLAARWRAGLLRPSPLRAGRLSLAAGAAAGGVLLLTGWILVPSPTEDRNWVQWTPELGHYAVHPGRVLEARLGGVEVRPGRMDGSASGRARDIVRAGGPISVTVRLGPPPGGLAPVLGLHDDHRQENLLLGQHGHDLVLRIRYRADELRLRRPDLRYRNALAGRAPGDTVRLTAWRPADDASPAGASPDPDRAAAGPSDGSAPAAGTPAADPRERRGGHCLAVDDARRCGLAFPPGRGWSLLVAPADLPPVAARALDAGWVGLLLLPLGLWGVRRRTTALGAVLAVGGLLAAPALSPLAAPGPAEALGLALGAGAGVVLRGHLSRRRDRPGRGPDPGPGPPTR